MVVDCVARSNLKRATYSILVVARLGRQLSYFGMIAWQFGHNDRRSRKTKLGPIPNVQQSYE